ncbi:MAG: TolC family outer membrane protein [Gammaproteobacteria bacterium]|nr:TolC family outer membrane protein [Gammaproteobacteria bacterium]
MNIRLATLTTLFLYLICYQSHLFANGLIDIYTIAKAQDTEFREAEANYLATSQASPIARAALLPQLNFSAETSDNTLETEGQTFGVSGGDVDYNSHGYSLRLTQSLYNRDFYVQLKQANNNVARAQAQFDASKQDLVLRVTELYFNVLAARDDLEFATAEKNAINRQLEQAENRFEVGLIPITDVKEAQSSFDSSVAREIDAEIALELAIDALAVITGDRITDLKTLSQRMQLVRPEPDSVTEWINKALNQNLALLINEYDTKIAKQEIQRNKAQHLPTVDIVAAYNDSDSGGLTGSRKTEDSRIGLELNFPIFQGGRTHYQTKESQYLYKASLQAHERIKRETTRDTRDAYHNVVAGISRVNAFNRAVESAEVAAEATEAGFEVGTRTSVDVLLTLRSVFQAQRDYSRSRYDYLLDTLRLKNAAGALSGDDLLQIDNWLE